MEYLTITYAHLNDLFVLFSELEWGSECEEQFITHSTEAGACFQPIYGWQGFRALAAYMQDVPDFENTLSAGGDKPLECR